MSKQQFSFSPAPSRQMAAYCWAAETRPVQAAVQICHGMSESLERYEPFLEYLTEAGFLVFGMDLPGHGRTPELNHTSLGQFGGVGETQRLAEDTAALRRRMESQIGTLPCFLLGHSMGSFLARLAVETPQADWDGLLLSGTAGKMPTTSLAKLLLKPMTLLKGKKATSAWVLKKMNRLFNARIDSPKTEVDWLSRDPEVCLNYQKNPFCAFDYSMEGYAQILDLLEQCNRDEWFQQFPKTLPVYLFSGDADPVGNQGKGPAEVCQRLQQAGCLDVTLKLYPEGRHEMLNELNRAEVWSDTVQWMQQQINRRC